MSTVPLPAGYDSLARQEAEFWGEVTSDPENPRLWDDPLLFDLFLRSGWDSLIGEVSANGGRVIDIACGEGNLSIELARRGLSVRGYDISRKRIARAITKSEHLPATERPEFIVADLNTAVFPPESADTVVAHDALHHLFALDFVLGQIRSALVPGGRFIVYDYVGMGTVRKLLAAFCYALLPTYQPYRSKLGLARRLGRFLATERKRREAINDEGAAARLRDESPFEEISQQSIVPAVERYFTVVRRSEQHAFFFYLAPKLRLPRRWRNLILARFARWDRFLVEHRICRGAYVYLLARKD